MLTRPDVRQIDKMVREATKPKAAPPKAKYIDPILATTFAQDRSLSDVCRALGQRMRDKDAVVSEFRRQQ